MERGGGIVSHLSKRDALFSLTIRLLSNGGFCIASSFRSLFLLFFSVWVQSTGAFVNWFAWLVKHRSFGESLSTLAMQLCIFFS